MNVLQSIVTVGAQGNLLADGLATLVVGIGVVFVALIALIIILTIMGNVFQNIDKKQEAEKARAQAALAPIVEETATQVVEEEVDEVDDLELVAVITATIAASMGTSVDGLQVRSIRKTNNVWGMSGRTEQLYN